MAAISLSSQSRQRQIVILAVGALILGGLLLFQIPRTLERLNPPAATPTKATQKAPAPATARPETAPATPVVPAATTPRPRRSPALSRFKSKDPFVQQVDADASPEAAAAPAPASPPPASPAPAPPAPAPSPPAAAPAASPPAAASTPAASKPEATSEAARPRFTVAPSGSATISVNGVTEKVTVSGTFPKKNPVFRLVSVSEDAAKIGIAGGTLTGGSQTVTLTKGEPLTLLNTVNGKRYKLELN
jgi:hypothetical protein